MEIHLLKVTKFYKSLYGEECKVLMSQMSQWVMSQWVRSEKVKVSVETIKWSITFTYFVYFLNYSLHKTYFWHEISTSTRAVC